LKQQVFSHDSDRVGLGYPLTEQEAAAAPGARHRGRQMIDIGKDTDDRNGADTDVDGADRYLGY
jgi:hypothetical protein